MGKQFVTIDAEKVFDKMSQSNENNEQQQDYEELLNKTEDRDTLG